MSKPKTTRWKLPLLAFLLLASINTVVAQAIIAGKITDDKSNPITGATVLVKNTTTGTTSTADGSYQLTASLKNGTYTIQFSSVGYKLQEKTVTITGAQRYTVDMVLPEDITGLDEVVVTGTSAGTTRRQLGSYISTVKAEDLTKGATGNVLAALQGKTAGAQIIQNSGDPAGGMSVRLRGISSISSSSEPLYIVDGVIVNNATNRVTNTQNTYDGNNFIGTVGQNRLVDINPADIERVEVLNGAAAAAVYGSRANAGVVQIFTKRGVSGAPILSFSTGLMVSSLRKKLDVNQSPTKFGPPTLTQDVIATGRKEVSPGVFADTLATLLTPTNRYDYQDYIFRTALGTDNNLSVSGGTEKTRYFASASFFKNQGIIRNADFQRYSFRVNVDQTLSSWATFNLGLNYVNSTANEKPDGNSFFSPMNSVTIIGNIHDIFARDANGNLLAVGERGRANPVSVIEDFKQRQNTSRIITNAGLKLKPFKNFTVDYTMGIDNYSQVGTTLLPPYSYNVGDGFFGGGISLDASRNGYASIGNNNFFAINHDVNATYNADLFRGLSSTSQVGFSQQYEKNNYTLFQGRGLAPLVETVNAAATILPGADERSELSISGVFAQQNFKYRNQLFLTGAARVDGSSVFGENQRSQTYLKASASYVISGADFWNNIDVSSWWDLLKFRVAYGESGNLTGIGPYARFNTYSPAAYLGKSALSGSSILANPNIKPERQNEIEFGTDMSFFKNRLTFTMNVYNKKVTDLLINRVYAPTTGYSNFLNNFGSLTNKGFEIVLGLTPVQNDNLTWNINAIYNRNRNTAVNIGQALTLFSTNAGAPIAILEGQPIGVFYGTYFARDAAGGEVKTPSGLLQTERGQQVGPLAVLPGRDPVTGLPTGSVLRKIIGNPNPDFTGSLVNELNYKKLGLRVQLDAVQGVDVFNADWRTRQGVGSGKIAEQEQRGQVPRGYVNSAYAVEEWRIDDGSFVKLREVSLSYQLGKVSNVFSNLTLLLSGRNLVSWDNYKGYDPEVNAGGQSTLLRGIDFGAVPIPRTFSFSIQARF
ncbi:SusC/RagA family TonB-linked outer membrane protein [Segetibacter sp. 3557_3]|uniref:SusC/RagA family TonB-linked outer membrane protein n=1 Tax=Segetibacter sp. 3557_3 TaxID=2547429 RepID=UPI001058A1CC|nr:SusC/RagA family TonB-linked outer membrane protein [Segetibacter sp. 3557_3]TDH27959.1 SusC/RagA family TonB-linked outer membrane protein [Segetibacter sp. 3557_3]